MNYFTVKNENGSWKMYNPEGKEFYSLGVDCVTVVDVDFSNASDVYTNDSQWFGKWSDKKLEELKELGFNTLASWHHPYYWGNGFPKAIELGLSRLSKKSE